MVRVATDTRTNILRTALQLFLQKGYKNVSYQELVKKTGLSKGAIYHYFASKEELLLAVFDMFSVSAKQPATVAPEELVKDYTSFKKLYTDVKMGQLNDFKAFFEAELVTYNWVLFCLEAIEANAQLRVTIREMAKLEIKFLEQCFVGLKKHDALPGGKDPALLAECLYYMLEGAGLVMFLIEYKKDEDFMEMYDKIITDFFNII
ncbi:MAG TPA: TetR/AcrR family transcriptional regulator [Mucilaginibacter sp.]|nr:TetR/AcrR family transcriptional regulator [Mucilaginibacter sp.]